MRNWRCAAAARPAPVRSRPPARLVPGRSFGSDRMRRTRTAISGNEGRSTLPPDNSPARTWMNSNATLEGVCTWMLVNSHSRFSMADRPPLAQRLLQDREIGRRAANLRAPASLADRSLRCRQAHRCCGCRPGLPPVPRSPRRRRPAGEALTHFAVAGTFGKAAGAIHRQARAARRPRRLDCADTRRFPNRRRSGRRSAWRHRGRCRLGGTACG